MTPEHIAIFGCGYVGRALAEILVADGHTVVAFSRSGATQIHGVEGVALDFRGEIPSDKVPTDLTQALFMAAPKEFSEAAYRSVYVESQRKVLMALQRTCPELRRYIFVSSTSVYAQSEGEWVDEAAPTEPTHFSGRVLLEAESVCSELFGPSAHCVRFGGIYGPDRTRMIEQVRRGAVRYQIDPPQYTNRIHRSDCAGCLRHLLTLGELEPIYLGVDNEPAPLSEVCTWLADRLGATLPPPAPSSAESRGLRSNKRCRNSRLREAGYQFAYPTFREGYESLLD